MFTFIRAESVGDLNVYQSRVNDKNYTFLMTPPRVCVLPYIEGDSPRSSDVFVKRDFLIGNSDWGCGSNSTFLASDYIEDGETETEAAHRLAYDEFKVKGTTHKLSHILSAPHHSNERVSLFLMNVKEYEDAHHTVPLRHLLTMITTPYNDTDAATATTILMMAYGMGL